MSAAFDKLARILAQERDEGFKNQVVMGGLDKLVASWRQEASREMQGSGNARLVDDVVELMTRYAEAHSPEVVQSLLVEGRALADAAGV